MKIQLILSQHKHLVVPFEDCKVVDIEQLDGIPDASCTFIQVGSCGDFIPNRQELLTKIISKLRYNGEILVEGTDLYEVSYGLVRGLLSTNDVQPLLCYGRYSCLSLEDVIVLLRQFNLSIVTSRLMQYKYSIKAKRPTK